MKRKVRKNFISNKSNIKQNNNKIEIGKKPTSALNSSSKNKYKPNININSVNPKIKENDNNIAKKIRNETAITSKKSNLNNKIITQSLKFANENKNNIRTEQPISNQFKLTRINTALYRLIVYLLIVYNS